MFCASPNLYRENDPVGCRVFEQDIEQLCLGHLKWWLVEEPRSSQIMTGQGGSCHDTLSSGEIAWYRAHFRRISMETILYIFGKIEFI